MRHDAVLQEIVTAHRQRWFGVKQRIRLDNALSAYVQTLLGFHTSLPKNERAAIVKRAAALLRGTTLDDRDERHLENVSWMVEMNDKAIEAFVSMEKSQVKAMKAFVKDLPIWTDWASDIVGIGEVGVATIIGECGGDVGKFPNEAALWKRMGVGVIFGVAQGKLPKTAPAELWKLHGYNKFRRARLYNIGDAIIKCSDSPYRAIYDARKLIEQEKAKAHGLEILPAAKIKKGRLDAISEGHIHRRAQRYMETRLLRHFYKAWKRTMEDKPRAATTAFVQAASYQDTQLTSDIYTREA